MKIVKILGGLGNQMFQYALYLSLRKLFPNEQVKIDIHCFNGYPLHNGYELKRVFGIEPPEANYKDLTMLSYPYFNYRLWQIGKRILPIRKTMCIEPASGAFEHSILENAKDCYYDGYWQNERYFKTIRKDILKAFTPLQMSDKSIELSKKVRSCHSLSIHVRRGDYVNHPLYSGICNEEYYEKAIDYVRKNNHLDVCCVFSNDIPWCKKHLASSLDGIQIIFVDWNKSSNSYEDIFLMAQCQYNIIANSSFSWWGAWLNVHPCKMVISPSKWNNSPNSQFEIPSEWHVI